MLFKPAVGLRHPQLRPAKQPIGPKDQKSVNVLVLAMQNQCKVTDITQGNIQITFSCGWPNITCKVRLKFFSLLSPILCYLTMSHPSWQTFLPRPPTFSAVQALLSTLHREISSHSSFGSLFSLSLCYTMVITFIHLVFQNDYPTGSHSFYNRFSV